MKTTALNCTFYRGNYLRTALGITMLALLLAGSVSAQVDDEAQSFLNLINGYRAQNNLGLLSLDAKLQDSASWMSDDMLANCVAGRYACSHTDSTGRTFDVRLRDFGYPVGITASAGENTAWGYNGGVTTAKQAFDLWRNSPGHNANMLGSSYVAIGISRSCNAGNDCAWVTDFGSQMIQPLNPTPTPTPTVTPTPTPAPVSTPNTSPTPTPTPVPSPTPTVTPTPTPLPAAGNISGYVISDTNRNGRWDPGEKGLPDWRIRLIGTDKDGRIIRKETFTDSRGFYRFTSAPAGRYIVQEKLRRDFVPTGSSVIAVALSNKDSTNNNFTVRGSGN